MAEGVIESLEVVEVEKKNRYRLPFAASQLQFPFERLFQEAAIEQSSQRITNRLFTQGLTELQTSQQKSDLRGRTDSQPLMRVPRTLLLGIRSEIRCACEFQMQDANCVPLCDHRQA